MKIISHAKKVKRLGWPHISIQSYVSNSGLLSLCDICYEYPDTGLILAFVERWHRETNSFHLPIGEMTITLDDVACLLHLLVEGQFCSNDTLEYEDALESLISLLAVDRPLVVDELAYSRGSKVRLSFVREAYVSCCDNQLWECATRAYLLHLVGCTIFSDKSATYVYLLYLELFRDLQTCGRFSWGVAALVYLYEPLGDVSFASIKQLVELDI